MNRRGLIIAVVAVLAGLVLAGAIVVVIAPSELNRPVMITVAVAMGYILWVIVFFLIIESWLCRLTGSLFGVTIKREFSRYSWGGYSGNRSLLDVLAISSWTVDGPASLSLRFAVGLLRVSFTLLAATLPIALGLIFYFGFIAKSMK